MGVELIWDLGHKAMSADTAKDIPYFGEIFGSFYNDDDYLKGRKTWDTL